MNTCAFDLSSAVLRRLIGVPIAVATLTWFVPAAYAEDQQPETTGAVETVIVTARRVEESRQDVPASVSAFTVKDLAQIGVVRMDDLRFSTPGLNIHWSSSLLSSRTNIRGIQEGATVSSADQPVAYYIDDVYLGSRLSTNFDLFDAERVEVLRGPQGTLFGRNAVGGVINVTTRAPSKTFEGDATVSVGNLDRRRLQTSVSGPLSDTLTARLSGVYFEQNGNVKDTVTGGTLGDLGSWGLRGQLAWQPAEGTEVRFAADYSRLLHQGAEQFDVLADGGLLPLFGVTDAGGFDRRVAQGRNPIQSYEGGGASVHATFDLGAMSLVSISGYRTYDYSTDSDVEASTLAWLDNTTSEKLDSFTQEFRLESDGKNRLDWMIGAFYLHQKTELSDKIFVQADLAGLFGAGPGFSDSRPNTRTDSWSLFAHGDLDITDKLNLALGVRATWDKKNFRTEQTSTFFLLDPVPLTRQKKSWDALTPSLSLSYKFLPQVMGYATVARGYKSGALNDTVLPDVGLVPIDPEYLWNYELGLKSVVLENRLLVNVAAFKMNWTNIQFTQFVPVGGVPTLIVGNVDKAHSKGAELEVQAWPLHNWQISGTYTYLDTAFESDSGVFSAGQRFLRTPKNSLNVASQVTLPIGGLVGKFRVDFTHQGSMQYDFRDTPTCCGLSGRDVTTGDSYDLLGARFSLASADDKWAVSLWGKNLTDKDYVLNMSNALGSLVVGRRAFVQLGEPRTYGIDVSFRF